MMAKRVTLVDRKAWDLVEELNKITPSMYLDRVSAIQTPW
jgi:hypothetical protein